MLFEMVTNFKEKTYFFKRVFKEEVSIYCSQVTE